MRKRSNLLLRIFISLHRVLSGFTQLYRKIDSKIGFTDTTLTACHSYNPCHILIDLILFFDNIA